ncbi:MAG: putative FAD-dependent pyridine nucleotide-disulfide oxidoreductase [Gammaproteobacteria bacterium]|nr:MAG: putative FAD-dependent pyridine nucleotide-disulfide oxidoreductase [Gammaproteobacteria bacterium]TND05022.1 MAG: putative FAD-dependent pyridine nucleotide-disulfide oxidoreductase [Gammaproteobacteria bacterium]
MATSSGTIVGEEAGHASSTRPPIASRLGVLLFSIGVMLAIYTGWQNRTTSLMTAESGAGYALGILGSVLMLVLLLYPLRKRARFMRNLGPIKYWFRTHMILGVVGPVCVLFHASFQWGSLNSNVALVCMLLVAGSGLIGRYIYTRIHFGLYGSKASLPVLTQHAMETWERLAASTDLPPELTQRLQRLEQAALIPLRGLLHGAARAAGFGIAVPWHELRARLALRRHLQHGAAAVLDRQRKKQLYRHTGRYVSDYIATIRKIAVLGFYERLFALWHVLHMPLFLMMLITGIVHVVFVHMY